MNFSAMPSTQQKLVKAGIIVLLMAFAVLAGFAELSEWQEYLIRGILIFCLMAFSGIVLSRAGRSPYWAVFVGIPFFPVVLFWLFAFCRWPKIGKEDKIGK